MDRISAVFETLKKADPQPVVELDHDDVFGLLVAAVLSAQATDVSVNKVTPKLFKVAGTPEKMAALSQSKLEGYVNSIGLFRNKARNLIALSRRLVDEHGSKVPDTFEELVKLPGVGRKTANVVLNTAFGKPVIAVDTHVHRVANRLDLARSDKPEEIERRLIKSVPDEYKLYAHRWLVLHGRYICRARSPRCGSCPISAYCPRRGVGEKTEEQA